MSLLENPASPQLDGRIDWGGDLAQLRAAFPADTVPIGTRSMTSDFGPVAACNPSGLGLDWYWLVVTPLPNT
jgi:hypothetical protein